MFDQASWIEKYDEAAQRFLEDEAVLAACPVTRTGGWATLGLSAVSGLGFIASHLHHRKKAGNLPQQFALAVTEDRLYALGLPRASTGLKVKLVRELARWDRDAITVETADVLMGTKLVITDAATGETIECQGGDGEITDRLVRALAPAATVPA